VVRNTARIGFNTQSFKYLFLKSILMSQRKYGYRRKTRDKISKSIREKSKFTVTKLLESYKAGDRVVLKLDSSFHTGMFLPRFHGKVGTVQGPRGKCYTIQMMDGNKEKTVVAHPAHLRRI